jgi:hypothetical protein
MPLVGAVSYEPDRDVHMLTKHLADALQGVRAQKVEVRGNTVTFRGGMFRLTSNWASSPPSAPARSWEIRRPA